MPDITMCSPTKYLPKCKTCYRRTAKPSEWQSYSNFYPNCNNPKTKYEFYINTKSCIKPYKNMYGSLDKTKLRAILRKAIGTDDFIENAANDIVHKKVD